ncbi:hypothetical protein BJY04DRAFT_221712 [Aspergillus karnatakaensis]|uniref:uncharacterized protein n=1 Tax=Aspergillus karnatakaensis TaxID=1810916 RepID=UPI003CCCFE82
MSTPTFTQFYSGPINTIDHLTSVQAREVCLGFASHLAFHGFKNFEVRVGYSPSRRGWWHLIMFTGPWGFITSKRVENAMLSFYTEQFVAVEPRFMRTEAWKGGRMPQATADEWIGDSIKPLERIVVQREHGCGNRGAGGVFVPSWLNNIQNAIHPLDPHPQRQINASELDILERTRGIQDPATAYLESRRITYCKIRVGYSPSRRQWRFAIALAGSSHFVISETAYAALDDLFFCLSADARVELDRFTLGGVGERRASPVGEDEWMEDSVPEFETVVVYGRY